MKHVLRAPLFLFTGSSHRAGRGNSSYKSYRKVTFFSFCTKQILLYTSLALCFSCSGYKKLPLPARPAASLSGSEFYRKAAAYDWKQRDSLAVQEILSGNMPAFLSWLVPISVTVPDTAGNLVQATFYVMPDYLGVGHDSDWARVPLTPMAAQQLADSLNCFLPTCKMVDAIYRHASVKLEPLPLSALRDSTPTMYQHHLMIEGQRQGRKGLIAGIKKDVVISDKVSLDPRPNRVAIYGWHRLDGKPIQSLYTGHVNWYVDYSHGIRLVYRQVKLGNKWVDYTEMLRDPKLRRLLSDEQSSDFLGYPY